MQIEVISQKAACEQTFDFPYVHISIRSPRAKKPKLSEDPNRLAALFLVFHDVEKIEGSLIAQLEARHGGPVMMTERHAQMILAFVKRWKDRIEGVVVNCEAGISRSAGVAAALAVIYGVDDAPIYKGRYPNTHVKSLLLRTAQGGTYLQATAADTDRKDQRKRDIRFS